MTILGILTAEKFLETGVLSVFSSIVSGTTTAILF